MNNTEWFSIRAMTLPATWVALIFAFICVWFIMRIRFSKQWSSLYGDTIFTFVIVWKFSVIITDFSTVMKQPLALLYFNGGTMGFYLGILAVGFQLWRKQQRMPFDEKGLIAIAWSLILTQSCYQIFMLLLNSNALWQELVTLVVVLSMTPVVLWKVSETILWKQQMFVLFTLVFAFMSTLQPLGILQTAMITNVLFLVLWLILLKNIDVMEENE
ncbi:MAG: hypothetical protein RR595_03040 [Lysinibacillus sp.]